MPGWFGFLFLPQGLGKYYKLTRALLKASSSCLWDFLLPCSCSCPACVPAPCSLLPAPCSVLCGVSSAPSLIVDSFLQLFYSYVLSVSHLFLHVLIKRKRKLLCLLYSDLCVSCHLVSCTSPSGFLSLTSLLKLLPLSLPYNLFALPKPSIFMFLAFHSFTPLCFCLSCSVSS